MAPNLKTICLGSEKAKERANAAKGIILAHHHGDCGRTISHAALAMLFAGILDLEDAVGHDRFVDPKGGVDPP